MDREIFETEWNVYLTVILGVATIDSATKLSR